eukprot:1051498-Rhodomonas_salina.2
MSPASLRPKALSLSLDLCAAVLSAPARGSTAQERRKKPDSRVEGRGLRKMNFNQLKVPKMGPCLYHYLERISERLPLQLFPQLIAAWKMLLNLRPDSRVGSGGMGASVVGLGLTIGGYVVVNHCMFNVEGGHRAVMYSRLSGLSPVVRGEGTHFKIPWLQRPYIYNIRSTPRNIKSLTGSRGTPERERSLRLA